MQIDFDDNDLQSLQYILINASGAGITLAMTHRLLTKIGMAIQQRGNGNAAQGLGERPDPGIISPRLEAEVAQADHSDSAQQRAARPSRR